MHGNDSFDEDVEELPRRQIPMHFQTSQPNNHLYTNQQLQTDQQLQTPHSRLLDLSHDQGAMTPNFTPLTSTKATQQLYGQQYQGVPISSQSSIRTHKDFHSQKISVTKSITPKQPELTEELHKLATRRAQQALDVSPGLRIFHDLDAVETKPKQNELQRERFVVPTQYRGAKPKIHAQPKLSFKPMKAMPTHSRSFVLIPAAPLEFKQSNNTHGFADGCSTLNDVD
eukprot:m.26521 g.26521  ORF g.26521 m.26521 type:complete len:227 (+) comp5863_c0_seq1:117-797(+)